MRSQLSSPHTVFAPGLRTQPDCEYPYTRRRDQNQHSRNRNHNTARVMRLAVGLVITLSTILTAMMQGKIIQYDASTYRFCPKGSDLLPWREITRVCLRPAHIRYRHRWATT